MISFIKERRYLLLVIMIALVVAIETLLRILWGFTSGDILVFIAMDVVAGIRFILTTVCAVVTILSIFKSQHNTPFILLWILIAIVAVILNRLPIAHFETIGGLLSLYKANPDQIRSDARTLGDQYSTMTCFGYTPQRYPCDKPISLDKLPSSIQEMHIQHVLIMDKYILLEKFGLNGVFRGFVVFREGHDFWRNRDSVTRSGCSECWKIRIVDGLYWYSANPSDRPIFIEPLK